MFEHGQWATAVPVWASSSISRSSSHTQCATTVRSPRIPRWRNTSIGPAPEPLQRLLHLPDRLRRVGVDPGVELLRQARRAPRSTPVGAVEQVLEAHPGADPAVGGGPVRFEQPPVGLHRLEVVEAGLVGHVGHQRGPDARRFGRRGRALHEPPHVHHRRGAGQHALGVTLQRRRGGDLRGQRPVGGIDVGLRASPTARATPQCPATGRSAGGSCAARGSPHGRWRRPPRPPRCEGRRRSPRPGRPPRCGRRRSAPSRDRAPQARRSRCPRPSRSWAARCRCERAWPSEARWRVFNKVSTARPTCSPSSHTRGAR